MNTLNVEKNMYVSNLHISNSFLHAIIIKNNLIVAIKSCGIAEKQTSEKQTLHYFIVFFLLCGKQNLTYNKIKLHLFVL